MNVHELSPQPTRFEPFKRNYQRFVPEHPGCYALTTFSRIVLYVGLADNLRRRMGNHLDDAAKTSLTPLGRVTLFHWIEGEDTNRIERTWMNIHITHEGRLPILNKIYSPTFS